MNNVELETLIRNILREQLVPTTSQTPKNSIFQTVDEAVCAAYQAFYVFNNVHLKPAAPLSALFAKN